MTDTKILVSLEWLRSVEWHHGECITCFGVKEHEPGCQLAAYIAEGEKREATDAPALVCAGCGGPGIQRSECPYDAELYDKHEPVVLCDECHTQRRMDM